MSTFTGVPRTRVPMTRERAATALVQSHRHVRQAWDELMIALDIHRHYLATEGVEELEEALGHLEIAAALVERSRA